MQATSNTHLITKVHRASVGFRPCLWLFSQTHIYTQLFFSPSLKSIESLRKYWQLEATTGWSDSRKPLIMITSSYFSFSFPPFFLSPALDLLPPWPGHDLLTNMSMSYLPQRRAADHSITSFPFLMPQNIHHCCLFYCMVSVYTDKQPSELMTHGGAGGCFL